MTAIDKANRSSRFLVGLFSIAFVISIGTLLWLANVNDRSIYQIRHILDSDLKEIEHELNSIQVTLSNKRTLSEEINFHLINSIETSHTAYAVILFTVVFLGISWFIILIHIRRLKDIKANEQHLEELLYYAQVSEIHESTFDETELPEAVRAIHLDRDAFIHELKNGLENNQFILYYQPIVKSLTGKIVGVEALIRWQHPIHGLLMPNTFLPLCENTGVITELGEWIFKTACSQIHEWQNMGFHQLQISINLSPVQINDPHLINFIISILTKNHLSENSVKLEITENSLLKDIEKNIQILQSIASLGTELSLDDFGTGYSSLHYLKRLPVTNLKIDKMFIDDMAINITSHGIVESVIALGKSLGLTVTAEGVENKNQLRILKEMGCDLLQGYLYSKPIPAEAFTQLLNSNDSGYSANIDSFTGGIKNYQYHILKNEHYDQAVNLISQAFCEYEPMTKYLGITPIAFIPFAKLLIQKAIKDGLSIVALDNDQIVACTIVEDIADPLNIDIDIDPRFNIIFSLLEHLGSDFLSERAMYKWHIAHLFITAVDKKYHGKGLSRKINFESIRLATEKNFDFMCCEFTHHYNEKGTVNHLKNSKLLMRSCKYSDFVFEGRKPFEHLDGSACAYIWELREGAKLRYRINN